MREIIQKRIGLVVNVALILCVLLLAAVIVRRYVMSDSPPRAKPPSVQLGSKITLPDIDWSKNNRHLVLVLKKDCHFCTESAPFYRQLALEAAARSDLQLIAVLPQNAVEADRYLGSLGLSIQTVRQATPTSLGLTGTPTLLLVNASGVITEAWVGKLSPDREADVRGHLGMK